MLYEKKSFILLTPSTHTNTSSYSTQKLFAIIHTLGINKSLLDKLLQRKIIFSFEIMAIREKGIQFVITTPQKYTKVVERSIYASLPEMKIEHITDYLPSDLSDAHIVGFKLKKHFAFPLGGQSSSENENPVTSITHMLTHLNQEELVVFQMILSPTYPSEAKSLSRKILYNGDILKDLESVKLSWYMYIFLIFIQIPMKILSFSLKEIVGMLTELIHGSSYDKSRTSCYSDQLYEDQLKESHKKPARVITSFEKDLLQAIQNKVNQPLFEGSIRVLVRGGNKRQKNERIQGIYATLSTFSHSLGQSLTLDISLPFMKKVSVFMFKKRILSFLNKANNSIYSKEEVSSLFHYPNTVLTKIEDLAKTREKILPAPLSLKQKRKKDSIIIGKNVFTDSETNIEVEEKQRRGHTYIIGGSGMGKTTMITSMAYQDILQGKGLCVLDPHGDLTKDILSFIPKQRQKDVVYINPLDNDYAVGLNILAPAGVSLSSQEQQERITSALITIFQKLTEEGYWGPRLEHILRNAVLTSYESHTPTEIPTLYTLQILLSDRSYRKKISNKLSDPILKNFWEKEFSLYGSMQLANVISPITNKLGKFITNKLARRILLQQQTTIDINKIINERKILLVNLSKGELGDERSFFFGSLITSLIQLAAYERTSIPEDKRKDFYLYIDEFQNFATSSFAEMVSESRKYHIYTILSHQNTAQIVSKDLLKVILGNVGTLIAFRTSPDDEAVLLPFFSPEAKKGDLVNLKPHQFIIKMRNERLEDSFTGETVVLKRQRVDEGIKAIIHENRIQYAKPVSEVDKQLDQVFSDTRGGSYLTSYFQVGKRKRKGAK